MWAAVVNRVIPWADMWRTPQARPGFIIKANVWHSSVIFTLDMAQSHMTHCVQQRCKSRQMVSSHPLWSLNNLLDPVVCHPDPQNEVLVEQVHLVSTRSERILNKRVGEAPINPDLFGCKQHCAVQSFGSSDTKTGIAVTFIWIWLNRNEDGPACQSIHISEEPLWR